MEQSEIGVPAAGKLAALREVSLRAGFRPTKNHETDARSLFGFKHTDGRNLIISADKTEEGVGDVTWAMQYPGTESMDQGDTVAEFQPVNAAWLLRRAQETGTIAEELMAETDALEALKALANDEATSVSKAKRLKKQIQETVAKKEARAAKAAQIVVPGIIYDKAPWKTTQQRVKEQIETSAEMFELARLVSANPVYQPSADSEITVQPDALKLWEDPDNGVVLLQLEHANSQGAICVYNNGMKVAAGVVAPATFKALKPVSTPAHLKSAPAGALVFEAAEQLLGSGVEVTPAARRHLTAILESEEVSLVKKAVPPPEKKPRKAKPVQEEPEPVVEEPVKLKAKRSRKIQGTTIVVAEEWRASNPYRDGTKAANAFDLLKTCKTVDEFDAAVALSPEKYRPSVLRYALRDGQITVE